MYLESRKIYKVIAVRPTGMANLHWPSAVPKTLMLPSSEPVASKVPAGEKASERMLPGPGSHWTAKIHTPVPML